MLANTKRMEEGGEMKKMKKRTWTEEKAEDGHQPPFF
jgi:hypothetical protein